MKKWTITNGLTLVKENKPVIIITEQTFYIGAIKKLGNTRQSGVSLQGGFNGYRNAVV
ncbi:MAG: hypothetical protein WBB64_11380 [Anaerolineales bacterium]